MRKSRLAYERAAGLESRGERIWFRWGFALLLIYLELVVLGGNIMDEKTGALSIVLPAVSAAVFCVTAVLLLSRLHLTDAEKHRRGGAAVAAAVFIATLAVLFMWQWAFWPGCFSSDSINQYSQAADGWYNNWHPVIHTWLFVLLPLKIFGGAWGVVFFQLLIFSGALAYLLFVMYDEGCPLWFILLSWAYTVLSPYTGSMLLFVWKDCVLDALLALLMGQLIRIYSDSGAWLKKPLNLAALTALSFLILNIRHNAVLLIGPLFIVLLVFIGRERKRLLLSAAAVLAATAIWAGPVLNIADVERPDQRVTETVGLPMSLLCSVYTRNADSMSPEVREFMDSLAEPWQWEECYRADEGFNSIKWYGNDDLADIVDARGTGTILRYALDSALRSPRYALSGVLRLTGFLWRINGDSLYWYAPAISANDYGISPQWHEPLVSAGLSYMSAAARAPLNLLFNYIGVPILALLLFAVAQLGGGRLGRVFLVIPVMAYNFGTMLLLSGADYRFFHFNFVIAAPLIYLMLRRGGKNEKASEPA